MKVWFTSNDGHQDIPSQSMFSAPEAAKVKAPTAATEEFCLQSAVGVVL